MILYIVVLLIGGIIGFYVGVVLGVYCYLRDHGLLSSQGSHVLKARTGTGGVRR